jgi:Do/DeqQ family serine protease
MAGLGHRDTARPYDHFASTGGSTTMTVNIRRTTFQSLQFIGAVLACALAFTTASAQPVPSLAPLVERVAPAVVNIAVSGSMEVDDPFSDNPFFRQFLDPQPTERPFQSAGSGVIVDADEGLVLTNHHVIENADEITVTLRDNRTAMASVVGSDQASDLAVLRIDLPRLTEIEIGNSDALRVGDYVVAIGNPFGFSNTVTSGIVSGLGRSGINPDEAAYEDFIQTDASINPGNSGGALVTLDGKLIGINSAILSRSGGNIGIGFAIPMSMATNVMDQLIEFGEVRRGLLGVSIGPIGPERVELYELEDTAGAFVTEVAPGSAAEAAGLQIEDVIVSVDGRPVANPSALRNMIGRYRPGDTVEIGFIRDGEKRTLSAVLGAQGSATFASEQEEPVEEQTLEPIFEGVELMVADAGGGLVGLRVTDIDQESIAWRAGLRRGDLIIRLNRQRVTTLAQARSIVQNSRGVVAQVRRGNRDSIVLLP